MSGTVTVWMVCIIFSLVSADNCVVNPSCTCPGSRVDCILRHGDDLVKFSNTSKYINSVYIIGNRNILGIPEDAFYGLSTDELSITKTGISFMNCTTFKGIDGKLEYLYLDGNWLSSVPSCTFQHVPKVSYLYMRNNILTIIQPSAFEKLLNLKILDLDDNSINTLSRDAFKGLPKLQDLTLSRNRLTDLDGSSFQELVNLRTLDLSHNRISWVLEGDFEGLGNLTDLDLSHNSIKTLDHTVFHKLFELSTLNIGHNHISEMHENTFGNLSHLYRVNMGSNNLDDLPEKLFASSPNIRHLNLFGQKFSVLAPGFVQTIRNLYTLNVSRNIFKELETGAFRNLYKLYSLDLSENRIERIQVDAFQNLSALNYLGLNSNQITEINGSYFDNISFNLTLDLSNNKISVIQKSFLQTRGGLNLSSNHLGSDLWPMLTSVLSDNAWLDLSHNPIGNLPEGQKPTFTHDGFVGLRNCSLTTVPDSLIPWGGIDVSHNELNNGIILNMRHGYTHGVNLRKNLISSPIRLSTGNAISIEISILTLSQNIFTRLDRFPLLSRANKDVLCDNYIQINELDLSGNKISFISPDACLGKVQTLDLSKNKLSLLSELLPRNQPPNSFRLTNLYLIGNNIHQIEPNVFANRDSLRRIDLSNNRIVGLEMFRNILSRPDFQSLTLTQNPLLCNCYLSWLRTIVTTRLIGARCANPLITDGYLPFCFPLDECSYELSYFKRYTPWDICESDINVKVRDLIILTNRNQMIVKWIKTGPGEITGFKVYYGINNDLSSFRQIKVHPQKYETTLDISKGVPYNVCVFAEIDSTKVSNVVCLTIEAVYFEEEIKRKIEIGLGVAASLLCLIAACTVFIFRRHRHKYKALDD